jgi:pimeloyl-ACP methyl ester carboxylesterase
MSASLKFEGNASATTKVWREAVLDLRVAAMRRVATATVVALFSVASPAAARQSGVQSDPVAWYAAYHRDSRLVQIPGGRVLNLYCVGAGSPTVILETGLGGDAYDWRAVHYKMAKLTQVCAYDRAGLGRSSAGPLPRDTKAEVADLEALLGAAHLRAPYVLVGHSMGGYNVRLFASRHPKDTAGVVLVDPSVENQIPILEAALPAIAENDRKSLAFVRSCAEPQAAAEVVANCTRAAPKGFPPDLAAAYVAAHGAAFFQTFRSEVESFLALDSQEVAAEGRKLGSTPFVILTRGERSSDMPADQAATEWNLWNQMHNDLAKLSTVGVNRVVPGANHYIQLDQPDAIVEAVQEVVGTARLRQMRSEPTHSPWIGCDSVRASSER